MEYKLVVSAVSYVIIFNYILVSCSNINFVKVVRNHTHLHDIQKPLVCLGISINSEISIFISFRDDKFRDPVWRVYQIFIFNGDSENQFFAFILFDINFILRETQSQAT